jgi:hypothetical protein
MIERGDRLARKSVNGGCGLDDIRIQVFGEQRIFCGSVKNRRRLREIFDLIV